MNIVTIVARNYLPQAQVLAAMFKANHPDGNAYVLVLDGPDTDVGPDLIKLQLDDLELSANEFRTRSIIYDVVELATAMKPAVIRNVIARTGDAVLYLDPDMAIYGPLEDLVDQTRAHGILVTPHSLSPLPDGAALDDQSLLVAGTFNLGCIGVGPTAMDFLDWWDQRLGRHCLFSPQDGLFFDQRWLDLAIQYFPNHVLRDPGCNVAWWNLATRRVVRARVYSVDGQPLRLFHWSGYDPLRPELLHTRSGAAAVRMPPGAVSELAASYAKSLLAAGYDAAQRTQYGFGFASDGSALTRGVRRAYREDILVGRGDLPNPFEEAHRGDYERWSRGIRRAEGIHKMFLAAVHRSQSLGQRSRFLRHLNVLKRLV